MAHRIHLDHDAPTPAVGQPYTIVGDEAEHARRVKRLQPGDRLLLLDGAGSIYTAETLSARRDLELRILAHEHATPVAPALHVYAAPPKGPRIDDLVDHLAQVGAASWTPLRTRLTVVDPREAKLARLHRIAREAAKQCGRAHALQLLDPADFDDALRPDPDHPAAVVLADAHAPPYTPIGAARVRLLVGPEGGFTDAERAAADAAGAQRASFGPHTMRIELAAPVAAAIILHREQQRA